MKNRNYNKLFVNKNREAGSDKIMFGYSSEARDTVLLKDAETTFHIPTYTASFRLDESTLIQDGATGGPFPAAADRIFKNRKNYGKVSSNGNTTETADGSWYCSWLYKNESGTLQWMDRFFNPGKLSFPESISQLLEEKAYNKNDPIFRDVPSVMVFEPGVMYRYFHIGEDTANKLVTKLGGLSGERLVLDLTNWGTEEVDASNNKNNVHIKTNAEYSELYPNLINSSRITKPVINFYNNKDIEVSVEYNSSYAFSDEFTLSFWAYNNDWQQSQSTQLIGNYSSAGGVGVFIDTLSSYPYFVIPETGYGHLLYINETGTGFLDHSLSITTSLTSTPKFVGIDSNNNAVICYADSSKKLIKLDHTGKILHETLLPSVTEEVRQLLCGKSGEITVFTSKHRYYYDAELNLVSAMVWATSLNTVASYVYDSVTEFYELHIANNVLDSKFIENTNWVISAIDGNLYRKLHNQSVPSLFAEFKDKASTFGIDPYNNIWVLHGTNKVSIIDPNLAPLSNPLKTFSVGPDTANTPNQKNINFFCSYSRADQTRNWKAVIYYNDHPQVFIFDINGNLTQAINMISLFNYTVIQKLKQNASLFQFNGKGDFTGYERNRVFNNLLPYKNSAQLLLKASLKNKNNENLTFAQFETNLSISNWPKNSWQHIVVTLKNRKFSIYVNGKLASFINYTGQYELSYELQPSLFIGSSVGNQSGFNTEIQHNSDTFNGMIQDVKMYDYALNEHHLEIFQRALIPAQNIVWSLFTPSVQYLETVDRMFKNKIPGSKATHFNIKLSGAQIQDKQTRNIIEQEIKNIVSRLQPVYANFLKIQWID